MKLSDIEDKERTDCKVCERKNTLGQGGWCITCFCLWYDGGPKYRDVGLVKAVSLLNPEGCYGPKTAEELVKNFPAEKLVRLLHEKSNSQDESE